MRLYKSANWYNPFYVDVNSKSYKISCIHFFDKDGIICSTKCGWFGSGDNRFSELGIPGDCYLKRKVDFSFKSCFIHFSGDKTWDNESEYELYIPRGVVGVKSPVIEKRNERFAVIRWDTLIDGVYCNLWHFLDQEISIIEHEISSVGEKISHMYQSNYSELPTCIQLLSKLNSERESALDKIREISDEYILHFYR